MTKTTKKKASQKKSAAKNATGSKKTQALSMDEAETILKSFHRVLRNKEVEHPVRLQFTTEKGDDCRVWDCRMINGERRCGWFPC